MKEDIIDNLWIIIATAALFLLVIFIANTTFDVRHDSTPQMDSIRKLNVVIEMDIKTIRAQNDTNWMYIDSTNYYRESFLLVRDSLWKCWGQR